MQPGPSGISSQSTNLQNLYQIDSIIIDNDDSETVPLHTTINAVTNSLEQKLDNISLFSPDKKENVTTGNGLLKKLFIGATILAGTGLLATGGFMCYMAGRSSTVARLDNADLSNRAGFPSIEHQVLSEITTESNIVNAETSRSPYSYYEKIHKHQQLTPVTTSTQPIQTTRTTRTPVTEKAEVVYIHDSQRNIYYDTLPVDKYRPLGKQLYMSLAEYCNSNIQTLVHKGHQATPERKCNILSEIINEIDYYKDIDNLRREINSRRDSLSPTEHADEIIIRRKLTTAYLAAEYVIDGKDAGTFYKDAMADHHVYSAQELSNREKRIMDYFPAHHNEC